MVEQARSLRPAGAVRPEEMIPTGQPGEGNVNVYVKPLFAL